MGQAIALCRGQRRNLTPWNSQIHAQSPFPPLAFSARLFPRGSQTMDQELPPSISELTAGQSCQNSTALTLLWHLINYSRYPSVIDCHVRNRSFAFELWRLQVEMWKSHSVGSQAKGFGGSSSPKKVSSAKHPLGNLSSMCNSVLAPGSCNNCVLAGRRVRGWEG